MSNPPVFLIPMGRTGGSLFVTILDAHRDLAMSYEIYQDRLFSDAGEPIDASWAVSALHAARDEDHKRWVKNIPDKNFRTFVARARRAGVEIDELLSELDDFFRSGGRFDDQAGRLDFIDRLMIYKMRKVEKRYWGGKAARVDPRALHARHPDATFFCMIRDGRDVLASQLSTGNFQTNPAKCAQEWRDHILGFRAFRDERDARAMEVRYERLVHEPEAVLRSVCRFVGVDYDPGMLSYHEQDLTLFRNPHGHLSHRQIALGLNPGSIGRWQRDLSAGDVEAFTAVNADLLGELGYLEEEG